jgi:hypothetical protein
MSKVTNENIKLAELRQLLGRAKPFIDGSKTPTTYKTTKAFGIELVSSRTEIEDKTIEFESIIQLEKVMSKFLVQTDIDRLVSELKEKAALKSIELENGFIVLFNLS